MNMALEKRERVITGGKGRGEIGSEMENVTEMVADATTIGNQEKRCEQLVDGS